MNKQPLLILVICFVFGICFQDRLTLQETSVYVIAGIGMLILSPIFFNSYFLYKIRPILLGCFFFVMGIVFHGFHTDQPLKNISSPSNSSIVFKISKKLNSTGKYKKYEAIVERNKIYFSSIIYLPQYSKELNFNNYYKAEAYITRAKSPRYDFQFNYAKYLSRKGIYYQTYISNIVSSVKRNDMTLGEKASAERLRILQNIDRVRMSSKTKAFLKGIILADKTEIDEATVKDFSRSGLIHFLAISGTHIVVIFGVFYFAFVQWLPLSFRKSSIILSLILIWAFAGFIGFGNSVLRSCIMLSVYFIYILLQRNPDLLHSLALSAFIILILDTHQIFDIGFQLSFIAVLGIFWLNQPILKYFPKQDTYFKRLIFNTISISLSAQLATLPLVLLYFHQFSFVSIISNFFIVPFSEIIIVFSFIMTAFIALGINIPPVSMMYDAIINMLLKMIHWFADFDALFFEGIAMNWNEVMIFFVIVYWLRFAIVRVDFRNTMRLVMAVLVFFIARITFNIIAEQKSEVLVQDFHKNKVLLIKNGSSVCFWIKDRAEKDKVVQYVVKPYIVSRRIHTVSIKFFPLQAQKVIYLGEIYDIK